MEHDASFGYWLTVRRQSLRLSRTELAARVGCAVVTLRKIEADERRPSREVAARLADQLAIAPHDRETFIRVARGELSVARLTPTGPIAARPTALPRIATDLTGRGREGEEIRAILARPEVRLLTITGAPGVGKSRLALEVATALQGDFTDGAVLAGLGSVSDPGLVMATVASALGVGEDGPDLVEQLGRYLRPRQILLVIDNVEHVLAAVRRLAQLLAVAPRLKLLVTSRVALELSGEHRFTVLPLLVPPPDSQRTPLTAAEALAHYPAVDLFVRRARAVAPGFALTDAAAPVVGEICRRLDGLPLAIELAAARAGLFTPAELLAQLEDRFAILTSRARDLPERQLSLHHAISWSYSLLAPAEQRLFRRLSVFVGGCTLAAAQKVCADDGETDPPIVDLVASLVASSLLQRHVSEDGRSRFEMLESVRAYALEQLVASGEAEAVRDRLAAYYLAMVEAAEREWDRPGEWVLMHRLVAVRDNLRAVLRRAIDNGDAELALRLNAGLFSYWATCSALNEGRQWFEMALALPRPASTPRLDAVEAKVLNGAGYATTELGDYARARAFFERGLARYRASGDTRGTAWSIRGCAFTFMMQNEFTNAERLYEESLALCRASDDAWGVAWSLYGLAFLRLAEGDLARARPALEAALAELRRQDMPFGVFRTLLALGHTRIQQGDLAAAEALYREGLELSQGAPMLAFVTIGLEGMGVVVAANGQPRQAVRLWGAAEALREATGERRWPVFQLAYQRALAASRAQLSEAEWAAAWAAGRLLTGAQAVAEALAVSVPA